MPEFGSPNAAVLGKSMIDSFKRFFEDPKLPLSRLPVEKSCAAGPSMIRTCAPIMGSTIAAPVCSLPSSPSDKVEIESLPRPQDS